MAMVLPAPPRDTAAKRQPRKLARISPEDKELAARVLQLLEKDKLYLEPDLKLASFARSLLEANHRVSACITGVLGFRNFNALINQYRIGAAKKALKSRDRRDVSILTIAMDCGFSSIGPFNRAFKTETGLTPSEYRRQNSVDEDV